MRTLESVLNLARSKLGTVESPPNSNNQEFGIWYGFNRQPWCAMFVSWVMAHAGLADQYRFASVAAALSWARQNGRHTTSFKAGYVACRLSTAVIGHTGIIEAVHSDGTVTTIEGNTSSDDAGDQRDGGIVARRRRPKSFWNNQCIRIVYSEPSTPPPSSPISETEEDMKLWLLRKEDESQVWITDLLTKRHIKSESELDDLVYLNNTQGGKMLWTPEPGTTTGEGSYRMIRVLGSTNTWLADIPIRS